MRIFCPNCEEETECNLPIEVYTCTECNEDFADYENPQIAELQSEIACLTARVKELEDANRWISVKERLPNVGEKVLTYSMWDKFYICVGLYVLNSNKKPNWVNEVTYNDIYPQFWMPLPSLPQEEE